MGDDYCDRHDIDIDAVSGYDRCPICMEEQRCNELEAERQQRTAPRSVDDPAPVESYRR